MSTATMERPTLKKDRFTKHFAPAIERMTEIMTTSEWSEIERKATSFTLADAIREGSQASEQEVGGFGQGENACALSAAIISCKARGL